MRCEIEKVARGTLVVSPNAWLELFVVDALVALVLVVGTVAWGAGDLRSSKRR